MTITPEQFLIDKLKTCGQYQLTAKDKALLETGLKDFLFKTITRKPFRKWSINEETEKHVKRALDLRLSKNDPLHFTFPFGAYKRWNLPSAPKADWAEFFSLSYYSQFMAPIAAAYEPGCKLSFVGDDVIVPRLDNYPAEQVAQWSKTFEQLIMAFHNNLPKNLRLELLHVRDLYTPEEFEQALVEKYDEGKAEWDAWDDKTRNAHLDSSSHNIKWNGIHDWTGLSDKEKEKKILESAILHNVYRKLERRKAFTRAEHRIAIFPHRITKAVPLGTTKNSAVFFWVGTGILERRGDDFVERILSYEQWQSRKGSLEEVAVSLEDIPIKSILIEK